MVLRSVPRLLQLHSHGHYTEFEGLHRMAVQNKHFIQSVMIHIAIYVI